MSDPVSNADIEDVLSSIRRLISAGQPDKQDSGEPASQAENKLILTPAFRVFDGDRAEPKNTDQGDAASLFSSGRDIPVEKLEQSQPASEDASEVTAESDESQELPPIDLSIDSDAAEHGLQSSADMPMPAADSQVDFEDNWDSDALGETAQVAFLHERMSRAAADTSLEDAEQKASAVEADDPVMASEVVAPAQGDTPEADETLDLSSDHKEVEDDDVSASDETVLETVGAALADDADDLTIDADDDDVGAEILVGKVEIEDAPVAEILEDDTDFIDEAHLQEIVSRIVRDELKGEIGVKITQAVRRMVRREVTRALSLEKFED